MPSLPRSRFLQLLAMPVGVGFAVSAAAGDYISGQMSGGEQLTLDVPQPAAMYVLLLEESGIDLVVRRPDLGPKAIANLPGRRWGSQPQVGWDLPVGVDTLTIAPLLANAPAGEYRYRWQSVDAIDGATRIALESLSRAAEAAPGRDAESTSKALWLLQTALAQEHSLGSMASAQMWFRVGQLYGRMGDWKAELGAYQRSIDGLLTQPGADQGLGHVLAAKSMSLLRDGQPRAATRVNVDAAAAAERAADTYQQALVANNACVIVRAHADMKAAAACFSEALVSYQQAGLIEHQSAVLTNLSAAYTSLGDGHAALDALEQAIELRTGMAGDDDEIAHASALLHLAQTQARLGRFDKALVSGQAALAIARRMGNSTGEVQSVRVLAQIHLDLGQEERAKSLLDAVSVADDDEARDSTRLALSVAALDSDLGRRATRLQQLQARASAVGDEATVARAQMLWATTPGVGTLATRIEAIRGALALAQRAGIVWLQIEAKVALAALVPELESDRLLASAQTQAHAADLPLEQHAVSYAMARRESAQGNWDGARLSVLAADKLEDQISLRMSAQQRHQFQRAQRARQQFAVGLAGPQTTDLDLQQRADWTLQRLLRSRAQLWREQVRERLYTDHAEYRFALEQLNFLTSMQVNEKVAPSQQLDLEAAIARVEWLEQTVSARRDRLSISQLQAQLPPGHQLILLVSGEPASVALRISNTDLRVIDLASAEILTAAAKSVRAGLSRQDPLGQKALSRRMNRLAELLAPAFFVGADTRGIHLLSDSLLDGLPIEVLAGVDPVSGDSSRSYVRWALTRDDDWFPKLPGGISNSAALVLLSEQPDSELLTSATLPPLPNATLEVANIAAGLDTSNTLQLTGVAAADWLTDAQTRRVGVLHIAAHAVNGPLSSASSVLALAGNGVRGRVNLGALSPNSLMADLTVLSGCSTGVGVRGDYRQGFAEAFIGAGSQQVLATLWPVDDEASAEFMSEFYRRLRLDQERSASVALAETKRHFASSNRWRDPYWWAGYQLWSGAFVAPASDQRLAQTR